MTKLRITHEWSSYEDSVAEVGETTARVGIFLDDYCLTRNHDIFSKTVRDQIHVSLYPLAMWFASAWWRLNYEVLPDCVREIPSHDWRMSHEMAAANMGFVWPQIIFSADGDNIQIWSQASQAQKEISVRFLNSLNHPCSIPKEQFIQEISSLISSVVARLHEVGCRNSDLEMIWRFIFEDLKNPNELMRRRLEALLGFDPEDCPNELIEKAIELERKMGEDSFSELTGAYAHHTGNRLYAMQKLIQEDGLNGEPQEILDFPVNYGAGEPWEIAVSAARSLRKKLSNISEALDDSILHDLLSLPTESLQKWFPGNQLKASVAGPENSRKMKFILRRRHPVTQRFELARFIGDYVRSAKHTPQSWLVSSDLSTSRQKFQRAFAAEFLCPINSLIKYLGDDFSETAREDAANHFLVTGRTVDSLLMNNGYLPRYTPFSGMPYNILT